MPELPEVETVVRQLQPLLTDRKLIRLEVRDAKLKLNTPLKLSGLKVREVCRMGKRIVFRLREGKSEPGAMAFHLGMTGRLIWNGAKALASDINKPKKHLRAVLHCQGGKLLFFDPRKFGKLSLVNSWEELKPTGIDPCREDFSVKELAGLLGQSRQLLKPWLMRQDRLVGLGNIYASEILYRSRLSPLREAGSLNPAEVSLLHRMTKTVLHEAISLCGTTFSDFQNASGESGGYQSFLRVYGKAGAPCRRCRAQILRLVQQGRSTFYCSSCQR